MENARLKLYPLKFRPLFSEKPWGGFRIRDEYGFPHMPQQPCGEAWLLSAVPGKSTLVDNGPLKGNTLEEVFEIFMEELTGEKAYKASPHLFPLLLKIVDAHEWLSIQVHPDDHLAEQRYGTGGKTEMWYILDAAPEAKLISGFDREIERSTLVFLAENGLLPDVMHYEKVRRGDVFFTPAGRVHAIGPGILLAEIQQTSDITYRIYDWGRKDAKGKPREMHLTESLDAIDFGVTTKAGTHPQHHPGGSEPLVQCPWFHVHRVTAEHPVKKDYTGTDSCVALLFTTGEGMLLSTPYAVPYRKGEVILLPATLEEVEMIPSQPSEWLEVSIP
ncbi:MAG TPA: class I mannose-6-phosphate isomerase [Bacteroidales bacterium]|nr:class I mannose-6-phosphate isomerase [Bacteroidales bacterium]HRZ47911.1 class I mannose-6-phosphate isomerase [Bacteroidales bacterium]